MYGWAESLQQPNCFASLPFFFSLFHFFFLFFFFCFLSYFYLASDSLRSDFGSVVRCYIRSLLLLFVVFFLGGNGWFECHAIVTSCCGVMMLLWEMLSGRRNKNKDKVRHQANSNSGEVSTTASTTNVVAVSSGAASTPPSSVAVVNNVGRHEEQGQVNVVSLRVHHNSARSESFSSPPSPHPPGSAAIVSSLFELPPAKQLPTLFRPAVGATSFANRTPDSIKLFKNSVLSRRHSTSAGLSPGLLGCPSTLGGGGVGAIAGGGANNAPQRARRRRGEDAQRYSDRRRQQHK